MLGASFEPTFKKNPTNVKNGSKKTSNLQQTVSEEVILSGTEHGRCLSCISNICKKQKSGMGLHRRLRLHPIKDFGSKETGFRKALAAPAEESEIRRNRNLQTDPSVKKEKNQEPISAVKFKVANDGRFFPIKMRRDPPFGDASDSDSEPILPILPQLRPHLPFFF